MWHVIAAVLALTILINGCTIWICKIAWSRNWYNDNTVNPIVLHHIHHMVTENRQTQAFVTDPMHFMGSAQQSACWLPSFNWITCRTIWWTGGLCIYHIPLRDLLLRNQFMFHITLVWCAVWTTFHSAVWLNSICLQMYSTQLKTQSVR